ncbi:MAG: SusC/RagA family TonB-linked outer membrane protein [Chitinophagaceae bacterium]|nr:MAG: SusC/RagA family TonB-linked outer membrane protein [Chitinophagaceae bacterium]
MSLELKNVSLTTALRKIEKITKLPFSYKSADVAAYRDVSISADDISLDKVLSDLFSNYGLQYEVVNSNIIVKKINAVKAAPTTVTENNKLVAKANGGVTGRIVTASGEPVGGASVLLLGTTYGTAADAEGRFSFSDLPAGNYRLQITAVGYNSEIRNITVTDGKTSDLSFTLTAGDGNLSEVTVTALGIRREKRELGYSAQEVKGADLVASRQSNIVNALQGQAAGLQINSGGGAPGQGAKIILRGINSLDPNRDFQPLFVVDGIPIDNSTDVSDGSSLKGISNRAADINPDDIESINVLKGGAATALYGLRAATGAIIITTKSGKSGKLRGSFTSTGSIDEINKFPETQKIYTQGNLNVYDPTSFWPSFGPTVAAAKAIDPTHPDELFNNYEHGYKTGRSFRNSLNLSGGTEKAIFSASFSQLNQDGIMPFTDYKNYSAKVGGQFKFSEKFQLNTSVNYIKSGGRRGEADRYNEQLTYFSPRWDIWDYEKPDGTQNTIVGSTNDNPIYVLSRKKYVDDVDRIIANANFVYSPVKWLDISYRAGIDLYNDSRTETTPGPLGVPGEIHPVGDLGFGSVAEYHAKNTVINSTFLLNFKHDIGKLSSSFKIGHDLYQTKRTTVNTIGDTLVVPTFYNLSNAKRVVATNSVRDYRIIGLFADWTLGWDNYLYLTFTGRNDWTSTLSKENRSFFYPSASLSWVFSENFELPEFISFGKARFSLAKIGKDALPYATSNGYVIGAPLTNGTLPFTLSSQTGDANLRPEFTTSYEGGIELRFLKNRLGLDLTYYNNTSKDLIIPVRVPITSGFDQIYLNSGSIRNKGVEISVNGSVIQSKDWGLDVRVNYTRNSNKVLSIYPGLTEIAMGSQFGYLSSTVTQKYVPGLPVGALFGRTYARYYGDKEEDPTVMDGSLPIIIGANGFPVLNAASKQQYIANSQPKWIGSLSSTLRYKALSLSFLFDTQQGVYRYNQFANFLGSFALQKGSENRNDTKVFNGVLADGTPNTKAVWLGQGVGPDGVNYGNGYYRNYYRGASEEFIENASWLRLRTLSLSYQVPAKFVQRSKFLTGASITFTGNNLWLDTKWSGFDPESSSTNSGSVVDGFSGFTYPATRNYIASINLNF